MIELGSLNNPRLAQGFIDYLKSEGFHGELKPAQDNTVIISVAAEHFHQVKPLWAEFAQNPNQEKYLQASWQVGSSHNALHYQGQPLNLFSRFKALSWLNQSVSIISIIVYIAFLAGGFESIYSALQFNATRPITWIAPAVVHFSLMHIAFNLVWWMSLGDTIEKQYGKLTLVGVFFISALLSNWAQYLMVGPNFGGLSGVVYALLGFCWISSLLNPQKPALVSRSTIGFMLIWLVVGFFDVLFIGMANWAHLAGLVSGMAFALTAHLFNVKTKA
ncbi:rhomboid family intramembrane serine protease GlpG [Pseudoalteromonas sp. MMG010]|uniref:rhomboid family intramembrane serine protease GlpG n=1 Tax=Pseudoalteromonas sp. MMG010 TaxID=2822685 RepID=UPI001B3A1540|nr:rhomboid family intramembrane serine protease GlpG [Pseudoalteromonas sp. MMG010]MBQ4834014.1 rhomboid family intramembrane serine protease GlpG [Pseudoalteromonas sp. MMG010]